MMNRTCSASLGDTAFRLSIVASDSFVYRRLVETAVAGTTRRRRATSAISGYLCQLSDHQDSGQSAQGMFGSEMYASNCWWAECDAGTNDEVPAMSDVEECVWAGGAVFLDDGPEVEVACCDAVSKSAFVEVDPCSDSSSAMIASAALRRVLSQSNGASLNRGSTTIDTTNIIRIIIISIIMCCISPSKWVSRV